MSQRINITSPVGRIVMGSLYEPNTTDADGKPLVVKTGPNAGQPRAQYFFALAIPKNPGEQHWAQTPWGAQIWQLGHQAFPHAAQAADFSWKIVDGDSQQPGKLYKGKPGKKPCENEGWPGHWVLKFSGGFAPKVYQQEGTGYVQRMEKDFCKPGYFAEVAFSVEGNNSQTSPGVYLNHSMVCFRAYGQEITFGPDVASAGFGAAPLPAGASMTPPAGTIPAPGVAAPAPLPSMPGQVPNVPLMANAGLPSYPVPPVAAAVPVNGLPQVPGVAPLPLPPAGSAPMPYAPVPGAPAPIPVTPNPGFVQMPPPAPVTPPARQMTAAAQGLPYEAYVAQGWTDAQLVQNGLMLA
jgi:hypothetical protein